MTNTTSPFGDAEQIELILTKARTGTGVNCMVVYQDESTRDLNVDALSMRGAQREMTGFMLRAGFTTVGRWEALDEDRRQIYESSRVFRRVGA